MIQIIDAVNQVNHQIQIAQIFKILNPNAGHNIAQFAYFGLEMPNDIDN